MKQMCSSLRLKLTIWKWALALSLIGTTSGNAPAQDAASLDNGDRLVVPFHWKIEHRAKSPADILVHQLGTPEARTILGIVASALGFDPAVANMITANIPLPHFDPAVTDNKGVLAAPNGMKVCKAGPVGTLETSHASWSARIVRNGTQNGLAYSTSVGTSPGTTHRIEGSFYIEYVKPVDNWEQKFGCMPNGKVVWDKTG